VNTRRQIIRWIGAVAGTVVGLLPRLRRQALAQETEELQFEPVATLADLEDNPLLLEDDEFSGGPALIFQTEGEDEEETLVALNPTCTHRGCIVDLKGDELVCPCHGATYSLDGKVTKGPATEDLVVYQIRIEDETILLAAEA